MVPLPVRHGATMSERAAGLVNHQRPVRSSRCVALLRKKKEWASGVGISSGGTSQPPLPRCSSLLQAAASGMGE